LPFLGNCYIGYRNPLELENVNFNFYKNLMFFLETKSKENRKLSSRNEPCTPKGMKILCVLES
ncbi:hypothetical protein, partial [Fischerella thermalis]|uniref:hypothetical protein n=1 Tax=Fischerella thermalis TaxID=372787 RepID=UPI001CA4D08A